MRYRVPCSVRFHTKATQSLLFTPQRRVSALVPLARHHTTNWLRVIRFHNPTGTLLLLLPCYIGMFAGWTQLMQSSAALSSGLTVWHMFDPTLPALFLIGAFTMRSAGCIINDLWDRKIDVHVERTKDRPIASGAMSLPTAYSWLVAHLTLGLGVLLCLHPSCFALSLAATPIVVAYPLAKRFTMCPQFVLGMCFNWGILVGNCAVLGTIDGLTCLTLYAACISWTILYDTVYAFQDIRDDRRIGVKSFAIYLDGKKDQLIHCIIAMANLFAMAGVHACQSGVYYTIIGGSLWYLYSQFRKLDERNTKACGAFFRLNVRFGCLCVLAWMCGNVALWMMRGVAESRRVKDSEQIDSTAERSAHSEKLPASAHWQRIYFAENCKILADLLGFPSDPLNKR